MVRTWPLWLIGWIALLAGLWAAAPQWSSLTQGGEFGFLPADSPSVRAEQLRQRAFPKDRSKSTIVFILHRH